MPTLRSAHVREGREAQALSGAERDHCNEIVPLFHSFGWSKWYLAWKIFLSLCVLFLFIVVEGNKTRQLAVQKSRHTERYTQLDHSKTPQKNIQVWDCWGNVCSGEKEARSKIRPPHGIINTSTLLRLFEVSESWSFLSDREAKYLK